jgi:hypothetical protein
MLSLYMNINYKAYHAEMTLINENKYKRYLNNASLIYFFISTLSFRHAHLNKSTFSTK